MRLGKVFLGIVVFLWGWWEAVALAQTGKGEAPTRWEGLSPETRRGWTRILELTLNPTEDPRQEWLDVRALAQLDPKVNQGVRESYGCRFPARWRYFFYGTHQSYQELRCPDLVEWQQQMTPLSISFVFASAYLGNPASMFGHNFIRLNLAGTPGSTRHDQENILDYGVAFMAATQPDDWLRYVYRGLTGGYIGGFLVQPYYELLNHYAYGEGRNLWEVEIPLTEFERLLLRDHLWEVLHSGFTPYYFTHVNCSSMLLKFIDAIKPSWSLRDQIGGIVAPPQAYKVVYQALLAEHGPNLKDLEFFWPSTRTLFLNQMRLISPSERLAVLEIIEQSLSINTPEYKQSVKSLGNLGQKPLEAALAWIQLRKSDLTYAEQTSIRTLEDSLMAARLDLPATEEKEPSVSQISKQDSPGQSHPAGAVGAGVGWSSHRGVSLEWAGRLGHHDFLDPGGGFDPYSSIEYLSLRVSQSQSPGKPQDTLWNLKVAEISSFPVVSDFEKNLSWTVQGGGGQGATFVEKYVYGKGGVGWSFEAPWLGNDQALVSGLAGLTLVQQVSGPRAYGLSLSPILKILRPMGSGLNLSVLLESYHGILGRWSEVASKERGPLSASLELRKNWGLQSFMDFQWITDFDGSHSFKTIWSYRF